LGAAPASVGGPFQLVGLLGRPADETLLKGKWTVVFFGFTYCPDVCPTTLQALAAAQQRLGPKADQMQVVFISLDPARDTPAQLKTYLGADGFPKGIIGLTGTPEQVAAAAKAYRVYFKKNGEGADYLVDHSTAAYLMDPKGRFDRAIPFGVSPEEIARQISDAMR
jgi:protein SCO1